MIIAFSLLLAWKHAVEEKLNELLDADGGISKRKVSIIDLYTDATFEIVFPYVQL